MGDWAPPVRARNGNMDIDSYTSHSRSSAEEEEARRRLEAFLLIQRKLRCSR